MSKYVKLAAAAALAIGLGLGVAWAPDARASQHWTIEAPTATNFSGEVHPPDYTIFTDTGANVIMSAWWVPSISPSNATHVENTINAAFPLVVDFDLALGGSCEGAEKVDGIDCAEGDATLGKWGTINLDEETANVFGVKYDNMFLAFVFDGPVSFFRISELSHGVSNIFAFNATVIPLPAGLVLFLSGLVGIGVLGRYKVKRREPEIV